MATFATLFVLLLAPSADGVIDPAGISGELILTGKDVPEAAVTRLVARAGADATVPLVAGANADRLTQLTNLLKNHKAQPRLVAAKDLAATLNDAKVIWLCGDAAELAKPLAAKGVAEACANFLKRGGTFAASGDVVQLLGKSNAGGLGLLPDAQISLAAPKNLPVTAVGYEVGDKAALLLRGRTLSVLGAAVTIHLPQCKERPARRIVLEGKKVEDLTMLRRAIRDRADRFPPAKVGTPLVEKGTLVIIGGGGMPAGMVSRFVDLAGGKNARIVVLPTAMPDPIPARDGLADAWRKLGAKVTVLKGRTREEVESKESLAALTEATGVWFGGGRQWRFVDAYENTKALPLLFGVLQRGGVIGGSSAGATIQGEYLCRGGVFTNFEIAYEGYERGLSFLPGTAIDQHFAQRKRFGDMTALMKRYPQYLGIGLDEATAIVVRGSVAEVTGKGKAHFYDARKKRAAGEADHDSLAAGQRYDLKDRKALEDAKEEKKNP